MTTCARLLILVAAGTAFAAGCKKKETAAGGGGGSTNTKDLSDAEKTVVYDLKRFGLAFNNYCDVNKGNVFNTPMPADITPLAAFFDNNPQDPGLLRFKAGNYKVFWGAPASQQIIACEKDAETKGGWVCMRLGDAQKKTAAEIQQELAKK